MAPPGKIVHWIPDERYAGMQAQANNAVRQMQPSNGLMRALPNYSSAQPQEAFFLGQVTPDLSQDDLHGWFSWKLQEERRDVLTHLENVHHRLMEQFQQRTSQTMVTSPSAYPASDLHFDSALWARRASAQKDADTVLLETEEAESSDNHSGKHLVSSDQNTPKPSVLGRSSRKSAISEFSRLSSDTTDKTDRPTAVLSDDSHIEITFEAIEDEVQREEEKEEQECRPETSIETHTASLPHSRSWIHYPFESTRRGQAFEIFFATMILMNTLTMALNAQYRGLQHGHHLSIRNYDQGKDQLWTGAKLAFQVLDLFFTVVFTIEWILRFVILGRAFLRDRWCYFDSLVVILAWVVFFAGDLFSINVTFIRLARFSKLLRLLRLFRSQEIFESLKLLAAAISASVNTLFWSLIIVLLVQCIAGLFMVQVLEPYLEDEKQDIKIQREVFNYFGTFWRAMITMFEITFANWAPSCRLLVDNVDELYGTFYLIYRCVIGFCVLMVVQAVFIQQTMKTTKLDDKHLANQKMKEMQHTKKKLEKIFLHLDESGDGFLEWEEMAPLLQTGDIASMFTLFDLEVKDIKTLFRILDDGSGRISIAEFVNGVEHVKGPARQIDLLEVKQYLKFNQGGVSKGVSSISNLRSMSGLNGASSPPKLSILSPRF